MAAEFPPVSDRGAELDRLATVYETISTGRHVVYLSAPLTTGPRLVTWRREVRQELAESSIAYQQGFQRAVFKPNRVAAAELARVLRSQLAEPVIDPTALPEQAGWRQNDYRVFWGLVIERFVSRVVFMDGWATSDGCSYEFLVAVRSGCDILDASLAPLALQAGIDAMTDGVRERRAHGEDATFAEAVLRGVLQLAPINLTR